MTRGTLAFCALAVLVACRREQRELRAAPEPSARPLPVSVTEQERRSLPGGHDYENNAYGISEGQRLYGWFNCYGCHGTGGGGGSGPALMDTAWVYGERPENVYASIAYGRPNGMPSFGSALPPDQIWKLVAYVRSLARLQRPDTSPPRGDSMPAQSERIP